MGALLNDPLVQTGVLPMAAAFVVAVVVRGVLGVGLGGALAGVSIGIGFMAAYSVILGAPPAPPRTANHKLPYIALAGIVLGALVEAFPPLRRLGGLIVFVLAAAAVLWLGERALLAGASAAVLPLVVAAVGSTVLWRLHAVGQHPQRRIDAPAVALIVALGVGMVALHSASASVAQLAFALAAATGGFLLINWPSPTCQAGPAATLSGGLPLLALVAVLALFTEAHPLALALLAIAILGGEAAQRLPLSQGPVGVALSPVLAGAVAAVPTAAAVVVMAVARSGGSLWPRF